MFEINNQNANLLKEMFAYTEETLVTSFFDGQFGTAIADKSVNPECGAIYVAEFIFVAGNYTSETAKDLLLFFPHKETKGYIFVPENDGWAELIKNTFSGGYRVLNRYAIKKEADVFDREKLSKFAKSLDGQFDIRRIDGDIYDMCKPLPQFTDFVSNFDSKEDFLKRGIGFVAIDKGKIAGGASSYTMYNRGIEIEVDTDKEYRCKGIATACAATLILYCLDNGLYPSWDAATMISLKLAEKLGYHFDYEYLCYELIVGEKNV